MAENYEVAYDARLINNGDRFVVSLIVGYDDLMVSTPASAVAHALELTRSDAGSLPWSVYDRKTGQSWCILQGMVDEEVADEQGR